MLNATASSAESTEWSRCPLFPAELCWILRPYSGNCCAAFCASSAPLHADRLRWPSAEARKLFLSFPQRARATVSAAGHSRGLGR